MTANDRSRKFLLAVFDPRLIEVVSAFTMLGWGLSLLNPFSTAFVTYASSYRFLAALAPQWAWGVFGLSAGLACLVGIRRHQRRLRLVGMMVIILYRVFQFILIGQSTHWSGPGLVDFFAWVLFAAVAYLRIGSGKHE